MNTLGYINAAIPTTGVLNPSTDPMVNNYVWQSPGNQTEKQPVVRIDYNLGANHRLSGYVEPGLGRPRSRSPEQRRSPVPHVARTIGKYVVGPPVARRHAALDARQQPRQRAARGLYAGRRRLLRQARNQRPPDVRGHGRPGAQFRSGRQHRSRRTGSRANGPSWRSAYQYTVDETLSWQKRSHSLTFGGSLFFGRAWENAQQMVPGICLGFNTTLDPANSMFTGGATGNFRDASAGQLTDARQLYAHPDRPRDGRHRTGRARSGHRAILVSRRAPARRQHERVLAVHAGLLARDAGTDDQCRPALGRADAVYAGQRRHDDRDAGGHLRRVRARQRRHVRQVQLLRARRDRWQVPRVLAVQDRGTSATTPTGTTSRRMSAWRGGRTCRAAGSAACSAIPIRRRCAPATRLPTSARAWASSPGSSAPIPGARSA